LFWAASELELQAPAVLAEDGELEVELAADVAPNEPAPGAVDP
jgi:hypothetical protein